jgi:hypothetical protein
MINDLAEVPNFQCVASAGSIFYEGFDTAQYSVHQRVFTSRGTFYLLEVFFFVGSVSMFWLTSGIQVLYFANVKNKRSFVRSQQ